MECIPHLVVQSINEPVWWVKLMLWISWEYSAMVGAMQLPMSRHKYLQLFSNNTGWLSDGTGIGNSARGLSLFGLGSLVRYGFSWLRCTTNCLLAPKVPWIYLCMHLWCCLHCLVCTSNCCCCCCCCFLLGRSEPFGSRLPSLCCRYHRKAIFAALNCLFLKFISMYVVMIPGIYFYVARLKLKSMLLFLCVEPTTKRL